MQFTNPKLNEALEVIKTDGLNHFRCVLTGAPYATLMDDEILMALESETIADPMVSVERLVDSWSLKALAYAGKSMPALRSQTKESLIPIMGRGRNGNVRIAVYMLTRLLFPHLGSASLDSEKIMNRAEFSRDMYDYLNTGSMDITVLTQELIAIDAYCAMPYWHDLWGFKSSFSKYGIDKAPKTVREAFDNPLTLVNSTLGITEVVKFMFQLMLYITERDGVAGNSGSKLAQEIMTMQAAAAPIPHVPSFQKVVTDEQLFGIQDRRAINTRTELKIAYSATHGKGHLPANSSEVFEARRAAMRMKAESAAKAKSEPKAKKPATPKVLSPLDAMMAKAFAAIVKK